MVKVIITREDITNEDIESIIEMAGFGISYWAESATHNTQLQSYSVTDAEDGGATSVVTYEAIRNAAVKAFNLGYLQPGCVSSFIDPYLDGDSGEPFHDFDANDGDVIIQLAIFDELVYG